MNFKRKDELLQQIVQRGFLCIFMFISINLCAQNHLKEIVTQITDSSQTESVKAKALYNWVTHHIVYDAKSFARNKVGYQTAERTFSRKKGLCYGYAKLYQKMCEMAGLECYVVLGYSKGYGYRDGSSFLRSNHAWNVVKVDTCWLMVDGTWGSGQIQSYSGLGDKVSGFFRRQTPLKTRMKFVSMPTDNYFGFSLSKIPISHHPVDPKWQFTEYPASIEKFTKDSSSAILRYCNYNQNITKIRGASEQVQRLEEGQNGLEHNLQNHFDLANAYLDYARSLAFNDSENADIQSIYHLYCMADSLISRHKNDLDSVFKYRQIELNKHLY